jgi:hypothetical protein
MRRKRPVALASNAGPGSAGEPITESLLRQYLFGETKVSADIADLVGNFNPKYINTKTRLLMREDPVVAFGMAIQESVILNMNWTVESKDPEITAFVDALMKPIYRALAVASVNAMGLGRQVVEKLWDVQPLEFEVKDGGMKRLPNAWIYRGFKAIDPQTCTLLVDHERDEWAGVEQIVATNSADRKAVGPDQVALWSFRKERVFGKLQGWPLLNQVYEPWWFKVALSLLANRYFERRADPQAVGRGQKTIDVGGKPVDGFAWLIRQMLAMRSGGSVVLPNDLVKGTNDKFAWALDYLMDDKRGDMFQDRIDAQDLQITRGLLLTDEAGTSQEMGGRARSETHLKTLGGVQEGFQKEFLEDFVNPQIVTPAVIFNYGEERARKAQAKLTTGGLTVEQKTLLGEVLKAILLADQLNKQGKRVSVLQLLNVRAILEHLNIPAQSEEDVQEAVDNAPEEPALGVPGDKPIEIDEETERGATKELVKVGAADPE